MLNQKNTPELSTQFKSSKIVVAMYSVAFVLAVLSVATNNVPLAILAAGLAITASIRDFIDHQISGNRGRRNGSTVYVPTSESGAPSGTPSNGFQFTNGTIAIFQNTSISPPGFDLYNLPVGVDAVGTPSQQNKITIGGIEYPVLDHIEITETGIASILRIPTPSAAE